jgi:ketosteroid isomerase-like protein
MADYVGIVRGIFDEWGQGNFRAGFERYDPYVVFVLGEGFPEPGPYWGHDGVRAFTRAFLGAWQRVTIAGEEFIGNGDSVFVSVCQVAHGAGSGATAEFRYFSVWTFRGETIVRIENFRERADAVAAIGLGG